MIERLRVAFQKEPGFNRAVTFSAGIAVYLSHAHSAEALLALADHALYDAKEKGRNQVVLLEPAL